MIKPQRIILSRKKGFRLQAASKAINGLEAVNCARPGRWGNPFKVGGYAEVPTRCGRGSSLRLVRDAGSAVRWFNRMLREGKTQGWSLADIRVELGGKNLACWCNGGPCHCDVLLFIANADKKVKP